MYTVEKISIAILIMYFVGYIVLHILIAILHKRVQKEVEDGNNTNEKKEQVKWLGRLEKWFPFIYVIFLLLAFAL